jgi:flagellar basal-body rod modification protein FlgD
VTISIANGTGQTVFTGNYAVNAGSNQPFTWDGKGNDGTQWPDGSYKLTATAADTAGNAVAVSTQIQGVVNSVDLTQSPPLLSINGQTYTVNQIKSIAQ